MSTSTLIVGAVMLLIALSPLIISFFKKGKDQPKTDNKE